MKTRLSILLHFLGGLIISNTTLAQEMEVEDSAEVFLEEYSDDFQEKFFEALKQKGIENYDKAIHLLLACKQIDSDKKVVDFELAKVYRETKELSLAQEYAINAVNSDPENFWYLHTLISILDKNNRGFSEVAAEIPNQNIRLKQNLALIYYQMQQYRNALEVLNNLKTSTFTENLSAQIREGIKQIEENTETFTYSTTVGAEESTTETGTIMHYKTYIANLIRAKNFLILDPVSKEALENYPAQPYFYYARGLALNKKNKYHDAISVLEESLDYMLDDIPLANKIYQEISTAYTGLNNPVKANIYLQKIKPGF